ncbi:MAG: hypothetical protein DCC71_22000 [Proteobacteria bacterium]|nr:MAG: hypothetical protein DCC71_22000 [Pseudomonadota bacterium]
MMRAARHVAATLACLLAFAAGARAADAPVRVATLLPHVEDALARMPALRVQVVASVRRSLREPVRDGVADLGSPHAPSLEALAAARPQLVVGDRSMHAALAANLEPLGAELLLLDAASVDATFDGLLQVGERVGAGAEMRREVDAARAALDALVLAEPVDTLALFGTAARWLVVTERSWLGDLLGRLRFRSVTAGAGGAERIPGYAEVSDEQVATTRPALVLVVTHGDPRAIRTQLDGKIGPAGAWSGVARSARRGVHVLDPGRFTVNPGLALPDVARALVALSNERARAALPPAGAER